MKSSELRSKLEALEKEYGDLEVTTEGCDCIGESGSVGEEYGQFMIYRATEEEAQKEHRRLQEQIRHLKDRDEELARQYPGMLP